MRRLARVLEPCRSRPVEQAFQPVDSFTGDEAQAPMPSAFVGKCSRLVRRTAVSRRTRAIVLALASAAAYAAPSAAQVAQQGGERAPAVVIRGQVPIPQIVTIRPREVPEYRLVNMLIPSRAYGEQLGTGYSLLPSLKVFGASFDNVTVRLDSVGAPALPSLPPIDFGPRPERYTIVKRQRAWCAPNWWCPSHKVKDVIVADYPANFPRR